MSILALFIILIIPTQGFSQVTKKTITFNSVTIPPGSCYIGADGGDLEVDLIIGKEHKGAIGTINDRASGMLKMQLVESKESAVVTRAIINMLEDWRPFILTMTADNGKEFAGHKEVAKELNIDYYFAHPYHSWERGSNENLNGLIRQYIPKKTDFSNLTIEFINRIETKLNRRPRKRFNSKKPIFVMDQLLFNKKVAFIG